MVTIGVSIGGHGLDGMAETETTERIILLNRTRYNDETYRRSSAHMSERCRCSKDSERRKSHIRPNTGIYVVDVGSSVVFLSHS